MRTKDSGDPTPLAPAALHILLTLAAGDRHGYAIMQDVQRESGGAYRLSPGTLYDNLQRLIGRQLVREMGPRANDADSRRRYYRLSAAGRAVLQAEIARLESVIREARLRLPRPAGAKGRL